MSEQETTDQLKQQLEDVKASRERLRELINESLRMEMYDGTDNFDWWLDHTIKHHSRVTPADLEDYGAARWEPETINESLDKWNAATKGDAT